MNDARCSVRNQGSPCPNKVVMVTPVSLCQAHQLEIAMQAVTGVLADAWSRASLDGQQPDEHELPAEHTDPHAGVSRETAQKAVLDRIRALTREGAVLVEPKDFTPLLAEIRRSRPWLQGELQRLVQNGDLFQADFGEYLAAKHLRS